MRFNEGFLSICSQYETIALQFLRTTKGIDAGEAEATAQHISVNSNYILSDDKNFINRVKLLHPHIKIISTLHLIAWLDYSKMIVGTPVYFSTLYNHWKFKQTQLQNAYREVGKYLGIEISRSEFKKRTSFRILGIRKK